MAKATEAKTIPRAVLRADSVQPVRFYSQVFALLINVWIGVQFYFFVRYLESGGQATAVPRPPGVEGWLPISALVSLRYWIETGIVNTIHPAGLIILVVIILTALLFKKAFCSWVCPIGFISEMLGNISDKLWRRRLVPPRWLDYPLRSLKYLLLAFFFYAVLVQMTPESVTSFVYSNYNQVADILMLRFFTHISTFALTVIASLFVLSLVVRGFWCRYLCPYGGLLGILGVISPSRIKRSLESCIDCGVCARVCPSFIDVDKVRQVYSDECTGCLACIDDCPVTGTLELRTYRSGTVLPRFFWAAALMLFFWGSLFAFKMAGPWDNSLTESQYVRHMPAVEKGEYVHP